MTYLSFTLEAISRGRDGSVFFSASKNLSFIISTSLSSNLTYELLPVDAFFSLLCKHQVACFGWIAVLETLQGIRLVTWPTRLKFPRLNCGCSINRSAQYRIQNLDFWLDGWLKNYWSSLPRYLFLHTYDVSTLCELPTFFILIIEHTVKSREEARLVLWHPMLLTEFRFD